VYMFLNKKKALNDNWIFFLSDEIIFNRVSEQKSFSKHTVPENQTVICAEVTIPKNGKISKLSNQEIYKTIIKDLIKVNIIKEKSEINDYYIRKEKNIYPIYDINFRENLNNSIKEIHKIKNLLTIGRYGLFNYNNMDHCIDMGFKIGEYLIKGKEKSDWNELMDIFDNYKIVD
jgi:protoporphyrinogen oxidase